MYNLFSVAFFTRNTPTIYIFHLVKKKNKQPKLIQDKCSSFYYSELDEKKGASSSLNHHLITMKNDSKLFNFNKANGHQSNCKMKSSQCCFVFGADIFVDAAAASFFWKVVKISAILNQKFVFVCSSYLTLTFYVLKLLLVKNYMPNNAVN